MSKTVRKGIDPDALGRMLSTFRADPSAASFQFRSSTDWKSGAQVTSIFSGYRQNGREITRKPPHELKGDEPAALLGSGKYVGPAGHLLHAMCHCLTVTTLHHGAARGMRIESMRAEADGSLDLRGFLGMTDTVRPGFRQIHLAAFIDSPHSPAQMYDLFQYAQGRSPICVTVRHGLNVGWEFDIETTEDGPDTEPVRHGVDYSALRGVLEAVKSNPVMGKARFYASSDWLGGTKVQSKHPGFDQAEGAYLIRHREQKPLDCLGDEPRELLGSDAGPARFESLLHAMANCLSVTTSYHAAARGLKLEGFQVRLAGDVDLRGFADLDDRVSSGYLNIRGRTRIRAGAGGEELRDFLKFSTAHSPICDSVCHPVHVTFSVVHNAKPIRVPAAA